MCQQLTNYSVIDANDFALGAGNTGKFTWYLMGNWETSGITASIDAVHFATAAHHRDTTREQIDIERVRITFFEKVLPLLELVKDSLIHQALQRIL